MRYRHLTWLILGFLGVLLAVGCTSKEQKELEEKRLQLDGKLAGLEETWENLQQMRSDLESSSAQLEELEEKPARRLSDEEKQAVEELPATIDQLKSDIETSYDTLQGQLAEFLNVGLNEFPEAPQTARALEIYSREALITATDHVDKAGDYKKAISILIAAKRYYDVVGITPYQPLVDKIDTYQDQRYMTADRFELIKKGMTTEDVGKAVGPAYHGNRRTDDERGLSYWLYPKREGGAAAVYFNSKGKVYNKDFNAVKPKVVDD